MTRKIFLFEFPIVRYFIRTLSGYSITVCLRVYIALALQISKVYILL